MSQNAEESRYLLQTFHFSHTESDGSNVYYGKNDTYFLHPEASGLLGTTVWTGSGPVHVHLRHVDAPSKGAILQLHGKECEILLQKSYTPQWMTVFNFLSHPLILVPISKDFTPLGEVQRIPDKQLKQEEREANMERLTDKYHVIIPSRPGRTPAPQPLRPLNYLQSQAA